jgi:uncharacterized protein (TIGR02996 family)
MLDETAFLKMITADPGDDGPRLLFADFLEEKGDAASLARSEFIRVQCALATTDLKDPAFRMLRRRESELLAANWTTWLRPACHALGEPRPDARGQEGLGPFRLRWVAQDTRFAHIIEQDAGNDQPYFQSTQFRRGFLAHATLFHKLSRGERHVALLWDREPIDGLSLLGYEPGAIRKTIAAIDGGERLRSLELGFTVEEAIADLAANPRLAGLRELIVRGVQETEDVAEIIAASSVFANLRVLMLDSCNVGHAGIDRLCRARFATKLDLLMILACGLTNEQARILARGWPDSSRLSLLDLTGNRMTESGWNAVRSRFPTAEPTARNFPWPARFYLPELKTEVR